MELARELKCGLIVIGQLDPSEEHARSALDFPRVAKNAPCSVCLVAAPSIPQEVAG